MKPLYSEFKVKKRVKKIFFEKIFLDYHFSSPKEPFCWQKKFTYYKPPFWCRGEGSNYPLLGISPSSGKSLGPILLALLVFVYISTLNSTNFYVGCIHTVLKVWDPWREFIFWRQAFPVALTSPLSTPPLDLTKFLVVPPLYSSIIKIKWFAIQLFLG